MHKINMDQEIIGGWLGDQLSNAGDYLGDKAYEGFITFIGWVDNVMLYVSITIIAFGIYCLIFKYTKPLQIGFICFLISMMLIVIGGVMI